jgi:predicted nucleotidyltransferase
MGAAARDVMLLHAHGIATKRETKDVDFAVMVESWDAFSALRQALIESGEFSPRPGPNHRLRHTRTSLPLDLVPFGGVERPDRTIAWPPTQDEVFNCFGASEALAVCVEVLLPGSIALPVAPIAALAMLKITAWDDRKRTHPGRDAGDLALYMRYYLDCGNFDRAALEHQDLFDVVDFNHEATGAELLGRDIAELIDPKAGEKLLDILTPEADPDSPFLLAQQMGLGMDHGRRLVEALCQGLAYRIWK